MHLGEAPDAAFSEIKVFSKDGERVDIGATRPSGQNSLEVLLGDLEPGTYTVVWQVSSVSDGHRTTGSYRFTVSGGGRLFLGTGGVAFQTSSETRPTAGNTAIRWVDFVGMALVVGAVGTLILVWRPALSGLPEDKRARVLRWLLLLAVVGPTVVGAALIADLFYTANAAAWEELGFLEALADILAETQFGTWLLVRLGVSVVLGVVSYRAVRAEMHSQGYMFGAAAVLCGILILGRSMVSHAAAESGSLGVISVASDFIHLAAASLWIGGLISLLAGIQGLRGEEVPPEVTGRVVSRFSNLALISVGLIAITGLYNAWLEVGSVGAFVDTSYGQVLLVKMGLLVPLLGLATANLLGVRLGLVGSLRRYTGEITGRVSLMLGIRIQGEVSFALLIFLMTALLANLPVARDTETRKGSASEAPMAMPALLEEMGINVTFGITPNRVGTNGFHLELLDAIGAPVQSEKPVTVQFFRLDQNISGDVLFLEPKGDGLYSASSDVLSIVGTWLATVTIPTSGDSSMAIDYMFRVADRSEESPAFLKGVIDLFTGREPELERTGPLVAPGPGAERGLDLLGRADLKMNLLESARECNNINGVITLLEYTSPNRMRYLIAGGGEAIIDGDTQWYRRDDAPWRLQTRNEAFRFPRFDYSSDARGVRLEGAHEIDGRLHQVVSFYSHRDDADYWFWIDTETGLISHLVMNVPPSHYMVSIFDLFDEGDSIPLPLGPEDNSIPRPSISETVSCRNYLPR